jgi:hypothetical protein
MHLLHLLVLVKGTAQAALRWCANGKCQIGLTSHNLEKPNDIE